ncbi:MAG TPA: ATP-binding protein [Alphaproteobacteria bacterium]|nr:ATP-binding protein [Alphaproteobacteria bacterium]
MDALLRLASSIAGKLALILVVFVACPLIIYSQFRDADEEKNALLLRSVREQGRLVAQALTPLLTSADAAALPKLRQGVEKVVDGPLKVRLLLRPQSAEPDNFFYMASVPPVAADLLQRERKELLETGILERLRGSCEGEGPLALRYTNPAGEQEVLSSVTPINTAVGCWAVITSHTTADFLGSSLGQPYWRTTAVQWAAAIYLIMAMLVISLFLGIWGNLRRFGRIARAIRQDRLRGASFAALNQVPELHGVAVEFDHMVGTLQGSAAAIRSAAEENAHALKTPIAVISQSLEPLKRAVPEADARGRRALQLIERSVDKLDALVSAARRMDEAIAELINPPREPVDLSALVARLLTDYEEKMRGDGLKLDQRVLPDMRVVGSIDLLETAIENIVENAISFSPAKGAVTVTLVTEGQEAVLTVADEGPGVDPRHLAMIFERYFSHRPARDPLGPGVEGETHFGIGLWIVRRNIEALDGSVTALNRPQGGLAITIRLPLAK